MAFEDFQTTDEYRNLNSLQQTDAAGQYYDQKVANDIPEEHREAGRKAFIEQKTPDALKTAIGGAHSFLSNIGNVESEAVAKLQGPEAVKQYEQSPERQETQNLNTEQAANIAKENRASGTVNIPYVGEVGAGNVYDMIGQSIPIIGMAGPLGEAAAGSFRGGAAGIPVLQKVAPWLAQTETAGAVAGAGQAANAPTVNESIEKTKQNVGTGIIAAPAIDLGIKSPSFLARGVGKVKGFFNKAGSEQQVGEEFNKNLTPEEKTKLTDYTNTPQAKQDYNLNTTSVTESPFAFRKASEIRNRILNIKGKQVSPGTEQIGINEQNTAKVSQNLSNTNVPNAQPEAVQSEAANTVEKQQAHINSPLTFQESTLPKSEDVAASESTTQTSGNLAGETYRKIYAADQEQQAAHAAIDPDKSIFVNTQSVADTVKKTTENSSVRNTAYSDSTLKPIFNRYYSEDNFTAGAKVIGEKGLGAAGYGGVVDESGIPIATNALPSPKQTGLPSTEGYNAEFSTKANPFYENDYSTKAPELPVRQMLDDKNTLENYIYDKSIARKEGSNEPNLNEKIDAAKTLSNAIKDNLKGQSAPSAIEGKTVGQAFREAQEGTKRFYTSYLEDTSGLPARITSNPETGEVTESHFSPSQTGKMYRAARNQNASPTAIEGRKIFDPTKPDVFVSSIRNIGNIKDIEPTVKQNILSHINEASDKPIEGFDKVYTKDIDTALRQNGFTKTADDLTSLRSDLEAKNQTLEGQNALLKMGKDKAQADLDASIASKLYSKGNPLTQDQVADIVLKSPESKQKALDLVNSAKDNGSSQRGLGQILLNKIKKDSIISNTRDITNKPIQGLNADKFNKLLVQHSDILEQTLGKQTFDAVKQLNDVAMKIEYSESGIPKRTAQVGEPEQHLYKGLTVETGSKVAKIGPPSAMLHSFQALKEFSKINYYKTLYAAQDPYIARSLMDAANSGKQGAVQTILDTLSKSSTIATPILTPETIKGSSFKQEQPESDNNAKPQSSNAIGATNAALASSKKNDSGFSLADLNPIGEAEASEIKVPENSPISGNVAEFKAQDKGSLERAVKKQGGVAMPEIMTMINAESSVKKLTGNGYAQITPPAWKQAEQALGRKLNRNNKDDYADATVAYYKWTAQQVKQTLGSKGTPSVKDVYTAYNAGIGGFKALHDAPPDTRSIDVVPPAVSNNNRYFYYNTKTGKPLTTKQTLYAYRTFVDKKMNEYSPIQATKSALALAQNTDNEPDMEPQ